MKKPDAFEHKRKMRDKANLRWIKHRHLVAPAFMLMGLCVVAITAEIYRETGIDLTGPALLLSIFVGGPLLVMALTHD